MARTHRRNIQKDPNDPDNHNGVITHLEPDFLECKVKWAFRSITVNKASGGDGITVELFQTLKDNAVKVLHKICQQIWKTQQWPQDWKRSVFIPIPKKDNAKECLNYCTTTLISHTSKVTPNFSKPGFNSMWTVNFQKFKLDSEKAEKPEIKLPTFVGSSKKQEFHKNIYFCLIDYAKTFDCVDHNKLWKIHQEMGIPDHLTCLWEICMQVKKQQLEPDRDQQTGSKVGKKYVKAVYCHPAYLTYIQSTSCKMQSWMKHKLESKFLGDISTTSDMQMASPLWQKMKKN